jgi:light-regulated signal transduction histidine kinase (bacteriophytochrome)
LIRGSIGIKPENTQQIFSIFQRLHRKNEFAGTGIGLAICKKIVLNHNGELTLSEAPRMALYLMSICQSKLLILLGKYFRMVFFAL